MNMSTNPDNNADNSKLENGAYKLSTLICSVILVVFCVLGLYGNILSVFVFAKPVMGRSTINVLLISLSVVDLLVISLSLFVFVLPGLSDSMDFGFTDNLYPFVILTLYPLAMSAQTCSVWTLILITLERYLAVCHPFKVNEIMNQKRTAMALLGVVVFSLSYNLIRFWEYRRSTDHPNGFDAYLRKDPLYFSVYITGLYLMTHFLAPFIIIVVLNISIARVIRVACTERRLMTSCKRMQGTNRSSSVTTRMTFVVTCMFGVCNSLAFVLNILEALRPDLFNQWSVLGFVLLDVSNIMILANCSTTFIVYLACCKKYRLCFAWYHKRICIICGLGGDFNPDIVGEDSSWNKHSFSSAHFRDRISSSTASSRRASIRRGSVKPILIANRRSSIKT